jgi:hypothetical protein
MSATTTVQDGQSGTDAHCRSVVLHVDLPDDHYGVDAQTATVVGHPSSTGHGCSDDQTKTAGAEQQAVGGHPPVGAHHGNATDGLLLILATQLDELEAVRIAATNRLRSLAAPSEDHGKGMDPASSSVRLCEAIAAEFVTFEKAATLELQRAMRRHPLGPWVKAQRGVGEKQAARLLAAIGDPYWHAAEDRPRTVSELWAYCGLHVLHPGQLRGDTHGNAAGVHLRDASQTSNDTHACLAGVAPSRRRGQRANWSGTARSRAYVVAESCMKQRSTACRADDGTTVHGPDCSCSPYRRAYDEARAKYAAAVHGADCPSCRRKAGEPLTDGHQHARAMRIVMKALLRDLWRESKRLHDEHGGPHETGR